MAMTALLPRRQVRDRAPWLLAATPVALLPWAAVLATTLPNTTQVRNWSTAWVGLDLLLAGGCALTTMLLRRNDSRAKTVAAAVAGAAAIDLWFDLVTAAPGAEFLLALACGVAETALIAACLHIALEPRIAAQPS
ncbi:hypothetical protein [Nocardia sp. NPDC052566]|uniref:hypothetical protein n=1 Tax=Nocardia sp. NPDC052566 TaxID=3364330 RepID=UPI0037C56F50